MPIVSSVFEQEHAQIDGRVWVTEIHTDDVGQQQLFYYLCDLNIIDPQLIIDDRAKMLNDAEAYENSKEGLQAKAEALQAQADVLIVQTDEILAKAQDVSDLAIAAGAIGLPAPLAKVP